MRIRRHCIPGRPLCMSGHRSMAHSDPHRRTTLILCIWLVVTCDRRTLAAHKRVWALRKSAARYVVALSEIDWSGGRMAYSTFGLRYGRPITWRLNSPSRIMHFMVP